MLLVVWTLGSDDNVLLFLIILFAIWLLLNVVEFPLRLMITILVLSRVSRSFLRQNPHDSPLP
jgi:hypothetical protein